MSDRVIEPSEIIIERAGYVNEDTAHVNPWTRCLARFVDYSLFFLLLLASRKLFHGHLPFGKYEHLIPFEFFVWIPIEALLLSQVGTTPGKWFLKTELKQGKRKKLDFTTALRRSFSVWFRGLGMGIVGLNFFCMLIAYNKLKIIQITSWDRDDHIVVTHSPVARWRIYVAVFVAVTAILYYYQEKNREYKNASGQLVRSIDEYSLQPLIAAGPYFPAENSSCNWSDRE